MMTAAELFQAALQHHLAGRLPEAETLYRQVLQSQPDHPDALHHLGMIACQVGRYDVAVECISRALKGDPSRADFHNNLGDAYRHWGRLEEALASFRRALVLRPDLLQAMNNIGGVLRQQGKREEAVAYYQQMLLLYPEAADLYNNLGNVLQEQGNFEAAIAQYRQAMALRPDSAETHYNMGAAFYAQGKLEEAAGRYQQALAVKSDYAEALMWLGKVRQEQGRHEEAVGCYQRVLTLGAANVDVFNNLGVALWAQGKQDEAISAYQQALALKPDFAEAHGNLGNVLRDQGRLEEAAGHYQRALTLKPDYAGAYNNLGNVLRDQDRVEEAASHYRQALTLKPDFAEAHYNLGQILGRQEKGGEAARHYQQALMFKPDYVDAENQLMHLLQHLCDWKHVEELIGRQKQRLLADSDSQVPPFTFLCIPCSPAEQLQSAQKWARARFSPAARLRENLAFRFTKTARQTLRVGYLSQDFRNHPVGWLIPELFELHDRQAVQVHAYSCGPDDGSNIRKRLVSACDKFVDVRAMSHVEAARHIYDDGIDLLIDLGGYTGPARTEIVALRPAPIQVNWLGYPGTMGAEFIDYIITDRFITPPGHEPFFSEKIVYLPDCYQINDRKRKIARRTPTRKECGLPTKGVVFCSFNHTYKITPAAFDVWMRLLQKVPGSVLWLLETNIDVAAHLRREAQARRVEPTRLVFAPRVPLEQHLARCRVADLFLDTLPYNGHVTTSDALWAGLPVLTCVGETFASRVAGSLLTAIGLPELITHSLKEYEALALQLARSPSKLAGLRARLEKNRLTAPLFDSKRFVRHIERAYRMMWERYLSGEAPGLIEVPQEGKKEGRPSVAKNRVS